MLNVDAGAAAVCVEAAGDHVAMIGDNGKILIFPIAELPEMSRGKGVKLQSYREGGLRDATDVQRRRRAGLDRHGGPHPKPGGVARLAGQARRGGPPCAKRLSCQQAFSASLDGLGVLRRFILTGAPGAGKTAVLRGLECAGHAVIEEAATDVIALQQALGNPSPHESAEFITLILERQIARQRLADDLKADHAFFDRSPICTHALATWLGFVPPAALTAELERLTRRQVYERHVFFLQPLGFITPTAARRVSYDEALRFGDLHEETYRAFGYVCVKIPPAPLAARIAAIERLAEISA